MGDFSTMSGCRDLLFNVMEHQFTIPRIKAFLDANNLTFLGFGQVQPQVLTDFKAQYSARTTSPTWRPGTPSNRRTRSHSATCISSGCRSGRRRDIVRFAVQASARSGRGS